MINHVKNSLSPYKSDALRSLHLVATDNHAVGALSDENMKHFDKKCLKRKRIMSPRMKKLTVALTVLGLVGKTIELIRVCRAPTRG